MRGPGLQLGTASICEIREAADGLDCKFGQGAHGTSAPTAARPRRTRRSGRRRRAARRPGSRRRPSCGAAPSRSGRTAPVVHTAVGSGASPAPDSGPEKRKAGTSARQVSIRPKPISSPLAPCNRRPRPRPRRRGRRRRVRSERDDRDAALSVLSEPAGSVLSLSQRGRRAEGTTEMRGGGGGSGYGLLGGGFALLHSAMACWAVAAAAAAAADSLAFLPAGRGRR